MPNSFYLFLLENKMMKIFICIIIAGALMEGVASEAACTSEILEGLSLGILFTEPERICHHVLPNFDHFHQSAKVCTPHDVNLDKLECLYQEFCSDGSDFRRNFNKYKVCLLLSMKSLVSCVNETQNVLRNAFESTNVNASEAKEICTRSHKDLLKCGRDDTGKFCGDKAGETLGRIIETMDSVFIAQCLMDHKAEVAPADETAAHKFQCSETTSATDKEIASAVDIAFTSGTDNKTASATFKFEVLWIILFKVLIAVMQY